MALFGFGKNKNKKNSDIFETPQQFYNDCIVDFHKKANEFGCANRGLIVIPELGPIGIKTVFTFLRDNYLQMEYGQNPQTYYYVIMSLCL